MTIKPTSLTCHNTCPIFCLFLAKKSSLISFLFRINIVIFSSVCPHGGQDAWSVAPRASSSLIIDCFVHQAEILQMVVAILEPMPLYQWRPPTCSLLIIPARKASWPFLDYLQLSEPATIASPVFPVRPSWMGNSLNVIQVRNLQGQ